MVKYKKIQTFKCDEDMYNFLQNLPKKSDFIRKAIINSMPVQKKDNRKKATLQDLQRSLNEVFKI